MDSIRGGTGHDILYSYAYAGDAKLYGEEGADTLLGQDGNDYLDDDFENDVHLGGHGDDRVFDSDGTDELQGNEDSNQHVRATGDANLFWQIGYELTHCRTLFFINDHSHQSWAAA